MRGWLGGEREQALLQFWTRQAGFSGEQARERLPQVVCLVRQGRDVVGASSVDPIDLDVLGGRRFWLFRWLLAHGLDRHWRALMGATFEALDARGPRPEGAPEGLCVVLDTEQRARFPKAEWRQPRIVYAGYLSDGGQLRIGYFSDQVSAARRTAAGAGSAYQIARFDQQGAVTAADVVAAWTSEGELAHEEAERRLDELLMVAIDEQGALAGVSTAYLAHHDQLQAEMWHFRVLVLGVHRRSDVALSLALAGRDRLVERYRTGEDRRGLGIVFEIENEGLKRHLPKGLWRETDFLLVGVNAVGAHVRVHYFPDVQAPEPTGSPSSSPSESPASPSLSASEPPAGASAPG